MSTRIVSIFGTRPEAIKMAPVIKLLQKEEGIDSLVCVTGQHEEMLRQVLNVFDIKPDFDLKIMTGQQTLTDVASAVLEGVGTVLDEVKPDWVMVHGDTTTTFAAGLAAYYRKISVAHVEAGLRSENLYSPWPEEGNRRLTGVLAEWHFAPTQRAYENLIGEGVKKSAIDIPGNTVIDALFQVVGRLHKDPKLERYCRDSIGPLDQNKRTILVTGHRRENFGSGIRSVCWGLRQLADRGDVEIVYPVHLNPNVREAVYELLGNHGSVKLVEPQDYLPFVWLLDQAEIVITDSGGIQEEAPSLGKPVLVTRENTERPEAVEAGTVLLVGTEGCNIVKEVSRLLDNPRDYARMTNAYNPYGDGNAAERIVESFRLIFQSAT